MKQHWHKIIYYFLVVLGTCILSNAAVRIKKVHHLEDRKFASEEYLDPEIDERDSGPEPPISPLDQQFLKKVNLHYLTPTNFPDKLNPYIKWDSIWASHLDFGQISAVTIDPDNNIGIFHRGERVWDTLTFGLDNKFNPNNGPIRQCTIKLLDRSGKVLLEWGKNMFYLPHGLTIDSLGNYWITDVALHQVFKFDYKDIEKHKQQLMKQRHTQRTSTLGTVDINNLFANSILKPSLTLGEPFQPGNDNKRFCKPTAVAVAVNGDFFVSDGYCNSRIIKFNKMGERIMEWGRTWDFEGNALHRKPPPKNAFLVPHALALAEEHNFIFIADRENARIVCSFASNGTFYKEYKNPILGGAIYSIAYANDRLYVVNGNRFQEGTHVRGFVLDIYSGEVLSQFAPNVDMNNPHDIAVTSDESEIYVVELNSHKIYKFRQDTRYLKSKPKLLNYRNTTEIPSIELSQDNAIITAKKPSQRALVIVAIVAALFFIGFCIFLAAILAKYQKRGCLFPPIKRRTDWNNEKKDNYKLTSFLESRKRFNFFEGRPNTRDFSKLNTEPETSEDENPENSLEKII